MDNKQKIEDMIEDSLFEVEQNLLAQTEMAQGFRSYAHCECGRYWATKEPICFTHCISCGKKVKRCWN